MDKKITKKKNTPTIEFYGLQDIVLDLVRKGKSYAYIADELTKYIKNDPKYNGYEFNRH